MKRYVLGKNVHDRHDNCGTAENISLWGVAEMCYAERLEQAEALMKEIYLDMDTEDAMKWFCKRDAFLKEGTETNGGQNENSSNG